VDIQELLDAYRKFHQHLGKPVAAEPRLLPGDRSKALDVAEEIRALSKKANGLLPGPGLGESIVQGLDLLAAWTQAHGEDRLNEAVAAWCFRLGQLLGEGLEAGLPIAELLEQERDDCLEALRPRDPPQ
jgi:hypothetical protein